MLLDVRLPGPSGLELQAALQRQGVALPVIFLTGHADVATSVRAMKAGAVDFLEKPVARDMLLDALARALARDAAQRATREEALRQEQRLAVLTPREREVFDRIVAGKLNKQIADELGIELAHRQGASRAIDGKAGRRLGGRARPARGRIARLTLLEGVRNTRVRPSAAPSYLTLSFGAEALHLGPLFAYPHSRDDSRRYNPARRMSQGARRCPMAMDGSRRVLVVEDDEGMREAIATLLGAAGIDSTVYASAEALLAEVAVDEAWCVISDLKLPAMSGFELLAALRARGARPPVILITAHDAPGMRNDAVRHGADAYLAKPFAGSALLAAIESVTSPARLK